MREGGSGDGRERRGIRGDQMVVCFKDQSTCFGKD